MWAWGAGVDQCEEGCSRRGIKDHNAKSEYPFLALGSAGEKPSHWYQS